MILEEYLKMNDTNIRQLHLISGIPETTVRSIDKREIDRWSIEYFDAIAKTVKKSRYTVIKELEVLNDKSGNVNKDTLTGKYNLENRRYIGNKSKLLNWISELVNKYTKGSTFFDVFAGTGVVTKKMLPIFSEFVINDFLYSNNVIYHAFFSTQKIDIQKIYSLQNEFRIINSNKLDDDYFVDNYGGRYFSEHDARIIGEIRTQIKNNQSLNEHERAVLIASLIYSVDKIANTVGHYDAYRKKVYLKDRFVFNLITPLNVSEKKVEIFREDSNALVRKVKADVAFIDPPYNSRQYSRFYHVLESIAKWNKPKLEGVARKPPVENMSEYSKTAAPEVFEDLISNLDTKYIVVTYNNTYNSKSSSSKNKITLEQILKTLNKAGNTKKFEMPFRYFNAGKTSFKGHKEYVFITEVTKKC
ncbi:DNA adenine methylase [Pediococcus ethanolidurans]|uniref:DNA adenine methylase n=1 Tax=Pediococcus ethanolidurans TaxID=319653 RepID=UPI0021E96E63|nr:DNA adenine methylase [Pediococcus ethanolidurans]MCV3327744.1 DNA adenine methylase [Pediococcus ethanolidurans]